MGHIQHLTIPTENKANIKQAIQRQWQGVNTQELIPTLQNQQKLAAFIGLWDTKTTQYLIDQLIQTKKYSEMQAEAQVMLWSKWNIDMTEQIYMHCMNHKDILFTKLTKTDQQLLNDMPTLD